MLLTGREDAPCGSVPADCHSVAPYSSHRPALCPLYCTAPQVVIFVKSVARARELNRLLNECNFPSTTIHSAMRQEERLQVRVPFVRFDSTAHPQLVHQRVPLACCTCGCLHLIHAGAA